MLARKWEKNMHHFAHLNERECFWAYESMIHKLAKQIILEEKSIYLPSYNKNGITISSEKKNFENILLENQQKNKLRPDALWKSGAEEIYIEFCYKHKINNQKRDIIISERIACIEVYLDDQSEFTLKEFLLHKDINRKWINKPFLGDIQIELNHNDIQTNLDERLIRPKLQTSAGSINKLLFTKDLKKKSYFFNAKFYKKPKDCPKKTFNSECKTCSCCQFKEEDDKWITEILCSYPYQTPWSRD